MGEDNEARVERRLNDHGDRIRALEIKDAARVEKMDNLCNQLDALSRKIDEWMEFMKTFFWKIIGIGVTGFFVMVTFFLWYIQSLPR